jgi:hypothetical protein
MGQPERDSQNRITSTGLSGQDSWDRTVGTGQPGKGSQALQISLCIFTFKILISGKTCPTYSRRKYVVRNHLWLNCPKLDYSDWYKLPPFPSGKPVFLPIISGAAHLKWNLNEKMPRFDSMRGSGHIFREKNFSVTVAKNVTFCEHVERKKTFVAIDVGTRIVMTQILRLLNADH